MTIRQSNDGTTIVDTEYYWQPMETCPSHRSRPQHQGEHMSKEAMKLALEALEYIEHNYMSLPAPAEKAITALREALAEQPAQQEPVAWMREGWGPDCGPYIEFYRDDEMGWRDRKEWTALYTSPPAQRKLLTFSTLCDIEYEITHRDGDFSILNFARAIEAKLKEKNA